MTPTQKKGALGNFVIAAEKVCSAISSFHIPNGEFFFFTKKSDCSIFDDTEKGVKMKNNNVRTVLVVDDNPMVTKLVAMSLNRLGYHHVKSVFSGATALEYAEQNRPGLVILDINMPKCDGVELAKQLKEAYDCAIIFSTGRMDASTVSRAMKVQSAAYLVKPYSPAQLQAALQMVGWHGEQESTLSKNVSNLPESSKRVACLD
jgi:CheY-like chemotaxis protein